MAEHVSINIVDLLAGNEARELLAVDWARATVVVHVRVSEQIFRILPQVEALLMRQ